MLKNLISVAIILLLTSAPTIVQADDTVYSGDGYNVYPIQNSDVQLAQETIVITDNYAFSGGPRFGHDRFTINVDMTFKNHGPDTTLQMGFPVLIDARDGEAVEIKTHFRTWVNGKEVKITRKQGVPNPLKDDWHFSNTVYTYTVSFNRGETKKIKHSYKVGGSDTSVGSWELKYILRTGALWKGVIEDFSLTYKTHISKAKDIVGFLPREQKAIVKGKALHLLWNFQNFEPQNDFLVMGGSSQYHWMATSVAQDINVKDVKKSYSYESSAILRYVKNKVFASYGYPFKSPFVRAQFYYLGSPYKESASFSEQKMSKEHREFVELLSKLEADKLKEEETQR